MALEVILEKEVKKAIEKVYIKLRKGKKEAFDRVEIDDAPISSMGISHIKLRHLDVFLEYVMFRSGQRRGVIESYALLNNLDTNKTNDYYAHWKKLKEQMENLEVYGIAPKLKTVCGTADVRQRRRKFAGLLNKHDNKKYKNKLLEFVRLYESFLKFETNNPRLTTIVNNSMAATLIEVLKNPFEAYYNKKREDFVFCSDRYGVELILVLKTQKTRGMNAELFTAYSQRYKKVQLLGRKIWKKIYKRKNGCLI